MPESSLLHAVTVAIGDPASFVGRDTDEPLPDWKARAVLAAVTPFLVAPALDDSDRPHVEEARRLLTAFREGRNPVPPGYSTTQTLVDIGRMLLGVLDKIAPNGEADGG